MNKIIMKYIGLAAVVVGSALLFVSGTGESSVVEIVAGVFLVAGVIYEIIKK